MVVANYQPEKPRRCPELMEGALQLVLDEDPSVEVVTFGSRRAPRLNGNHRRLGLVEPAALADLYREARVGLSMSATNPSRVPFEMMAAGLPVVELAGENTFFDLPEDGCRRVESDEATLAAALQEILGNQEVSGSLSRGGSEFMVHRPTHSEVGAFLRTCQALISPESQPGTLLN